MLDIYILIVPSIGLILVTTLIVLKYTLAQPKFNDLSKYQRKIQKLQTNDVKKQNAKQTDELQQIGFKKTAKYLLKNYTLPQFYFIRRSRNKIPLLLSMSVIALMSYLINIPYIFSIIGGIVTIIYAFGKMLSSKDVQTTNENLNLVKGTEKVKDKLEIVLTCITVGVDLLVIGLIYKNYRNSLLFDSSINLIINMALDNFVVKPALLMMIALPISKIQFINEFINCEIQIVEILHQVRFLKRTNFYISAISPKKHRMSPSKVPKASLQMQGRLKSSQKQKYLSSFELNKGIKKQKLSPLSLRKRAYPNEQGNSSLMSILSSNEKNKQRANDSFDQRAEDKLQEQGRKNSIDSEDSKFSFENRKKNKLYSSKRVLINADNSIINELNVENQQEQVGKSSIYYNNLKHQKSQKSLKDNHSKFSRNDELLLVSISNGNTGDIQIDHEVVSDQNQSDLNQMNRAISPLEEQSIVGPSSINTSRKRGLLKIHQDKNGEDLEEIDLNSPERRRQQLSKVMEEDDKDKVKKKKAHKKYSLDPNRHVIKHTTGEPYLEFLPNLLNKERQQKKKRTQQFSQQQFSRKIELFNNDSRHSKSVKRTKNNKDPIVRQNDENRIPEFIVEDFES